MNKRALNVQEFVFLGLPEAEPTQKFGSGSSQKISGTRDSGSAKTLVNYKKIPTVSL